ncbi:MAG TPA: energy-coupling factor ABC transporter ATP-binding protein [Desulfotomaculum sp.]|nr:energy-coupling factor ABC transporter ATP-binding protein [Desulfotomaculum sp.]
MIRMDNIWYAYNRGTPIQTNALSGLSLAVSRGSFVALAGHTGSGKSTVLQHLNGLLLPQKGRVLVEEADTRDKSFRRSLWAKVGLVQQYPERQFFEETVFSEVAVGPNNLGLSPAEVEDRVLEALAVVGIDRKRARETSPYALSGGEQRRVALASVLALRPGVLALDEPTAGIDFMGRQRIFKALADLKSQGVTIIMASHNMDDVARMADRVVVIKEGRALLEGSPRQVFASQGCVREAGLNLPFPSEVMARLREKGFNTEAPALTVDEAAEEIIKCVGARKTAQ